MPVIKGECYWVECDKCHANQDIGDISIPHFSDKGEAVQDAEDAEWVESEGKIWCGCCAPLCKCGGAFINHEEYGAHVSHQNYCDHEKNCLCMKFDPEEEESDG